MRYLIVKRRRSKKIAELIKTGDITALKRLFWDAHQSEREVSKKPYSRFYRKLRRLNQSSHVPALFQTKNKFVGDEDTFSTIIKVVDDDVSVGKEEALALEDVLGWVDYVSNYKNRFDKVIESGAENTLVLDSLGQRVARNGDVKRNSFPRTFKVPVLNKDGVVNESDIYFENYDDLIDFIKDKKREVNLSFTQNFIDEFFKKSRLYNVMVDQALFVRRLQLIIERLNSIPRAKLSEDQLALKALIEETLAQPKNQARSDAMKVVRDKELWGEFWATLKFWKSKRVATEAKYTLPSSILDKAKAMSPYGVMVRSTAIIAIGTGAIITPISIVYNDNPWVMYITSLISNYFNDFLVFDAGLPSSSLSSCYKSERAWSIEEGSTMNSFVESHLSRFTAFQRIDPSYDPGQDPNYVEKKLELQALCSKLRLEYKSANRHVENKELLSEHGYRFAVHLVLIDLVKESEPKGEQIAPLLYDYFELSELYEDKDKAEAIASRIEGLTSPSFLIKLKTYQDQVGEIVPRVRAGDFPIYYPSTDDFFEKIQISQE